MPEQATRIIRAAMPAGADLLAVEHFSDYFRRLYGDSRLDEKGIGELLRVGKAAEVNFRTAAECFKLIDEDSGATVFVRYRRDESDEEIDMLLNTLKKQGPERWLLRKLQRYGVSIYQNDLNRLLAFGDIEALPGDCTGLYIQSANNDVLYDRILGINLDGAPGDPASLVQ
jgi:CRISPR-associated endonuclease/helicase Cas3